jgi:hypothetical protein
MPSTGEDKPEKLLISIWNLDKNVLLDEPYMKAQRRENIGSASSRVLAVG